MSTQIDASHVDTLLRDAGIIAPPRLPGSDAAEAAQLAALAPQTRISEEKAIRYFQEWCEHYGVESMPPAPDTIAAYISYRVTDVDDPEERRRQKRKGFPSHLRQGWTVGYVKVWVVAYHRLWKEWANGQEALGLPRPADPFETAAVRKTLKGESRIHARAPGQAAPLTAGVLARIRITAYDPRISRGGKVETQRHAFWRATRDVAVTHLSTHAALRGSELTALTWADFHQRDDGVGIVTVRKSKTDQESEGAVRPVLPEIAEMVMRFRPPGAADEDWIFPGLYGRMPVESVTAIVRAAVKAAGVRNWEDYSSHSGRVGAVHILSKAGATPQAIAAHGRWKSLEMVARYAREYTGDHILGHYAEEMEDDIIIPGKMLELCDAGDTLIGGGNGNSPHDVTSG